MDRKSKRALLGSALVLLLVAVPGVSARAKKREKGAANDASFHAKLSPEQKIVHALNRLTFGPRPGDFERVQAMGLKKWIDLELHPSRIAENPALAEKLQPLDSLRMSASEMVMRYPPPQLVRAMAMGRQPYPADPEQRQRFERLAKIYGRRLQQQGEKQETPRPAAQLASLFSPEQVRTLRRGAPEDRAQLLTSLSEDQQMELLEAAPGGLRLQILAGLPAESRRKMMSNFAPLRLVVQDLMDAKLYRAVDSNRQLQEVLVDFWYNHFNVYLDKGADRFLVTSYERDAIRPHVLGKFKDLLVATAESPAMLFYLDNWQSVDPRAAERMAGMAARLGRRLPAQAQRARRGLNENYARELMELHTLGVNGGYTQKDVIEVARCFTGWTIRNPQRGGGFFFNERLNDAGEKVVLGIKIPAGGGMNDGLRVLDILAHHPSTAHLISRELAQRFVADDPPDELVEKMARTFLKTGGDIREVMQTMLSAPEFWSQGAYRAKVKSPLEMVASAVRALDARVTLPVGLGAEIAQLGQPLYRKQEPTGYSNSSQEWLNTNSLLARMNFAGLLAGNKLPGVRVDADRLWGAPPADPELIARKLLLTGASGKTLAAIAQSGKVQPAEVAALVLGSPDFQRK